MEVEVPMPETEERAQLPIPKSAPAAAPAAAKEDDVVAVHRLMVHFHTVQVLDTRQDVIKLLVPFLCLGKVRSKEERRSWGH